MIKSLLVSIRVRIVLLIVLATIPAMVLIYYIAHEQRDAQLTSIRDASLHETIITAHTIGYVFANAKSILTTASDVIASHDNDRSFSLSYLGYLLKQFPYYNNIATTDETGNLKLSVLPATGSINYQDRLWFKRVQETQDFSIGEYVFGRVTKAHIITLAYPLKKHGRFSGAVFFSIDLEWLAKQLSAVSLSHGATLSVIDSKGVILTMLPGHQQWVGKKFPDANILTTILNTRQGMEEDVEQGYIYSFAPVEGTSGNVFVSYRISKEKSLANIDRTLMRNMFLLTFVFLVTIAGALLLGQVFIMKRIRKLVDASRRLGKDDLKARTGFGQEKDELGRVAEALDSMAESLEARFQELTQTQESLRKSRETYYNLFNNSEVGMFRSRLDGSSILEVNEKFLKIFRRTRDEVIGKPSVIHWADLSEREEMVRRLVAGERVIDFPCKMLIKTGEVRECVVSLSINPDEDLLDGSITDVTERKQAEEALLRSQLQYQDLVDNQSIGMYRILVRKERPWGMPDEPPYQYEFMNDRYCQLTGVSREEHLANPTLTLRLIHPDEYDAFAEKNEEANRTLNPFVWEGCMVIRGAARWMHYESRPRELPGGDKVWTGILMDITERKQAEDALRESEERFRQLGEASFEGIAVSEKGRFVDGNSQLFKMLGYEMSEMIGKPVSDFIAPESRELVKERILAKDERPYEHLMLRKDGSTFPVEAHGKMMIWDGRSARITALHDITDRKQAELELRSSEERYRTIFEEAGDYVFMFELYPDQIPVIVDANEGALRVHGFSRQELIGQPITIIDPDVSPEIIEERMGIIMRGEVATFEVRHTCKNGKTFDAEVKSHLVRIGDKDFIVSIERDITERKRAEIALYESEERYSQITKCVPDLIWTIDLSGRFTYVNPAVERTHGWTVEEFLKLTFRDITTHQQADKELAVFREELAKTKEPHYNRNNIFTFETEDLRKDGSTFRSEVSAAFLWSDISKPIGLIGTTRNISERKRAEEERQDLQERLQRAEKMEALGQLAGGVAHDLNNVLGVTMAYAEMMQEKVESGTQLRKYADSIFASTEKAAAMIQDLLTMARRGVSVSEVVDLNRMVSNVLKSAEYNAMRDFNPSVEFRAELSEESLMISGSQVHLEKTVFNLLSNAAESISGRGMVTVRTERQYLDKPVHGHDEVKEGEYAVLKVEDTGGGIPREDLSRIFEPFFTKKKMGRSGTGLGLAIVWGTVKDHAGYIDIESESGKGTTFMLYFPVTKGKPAGEEEKISIGQYMGHGESVLVVDDVFEQRQIAEEILTKLNYKVTTLPSGEEAVSYLESHKADIVILDMIMDPGIDGLDTYREMLKINPGQKAIIVSGFSETERVREARALGAGAYVRKPYNKGKIGITIKNELERG